MHTNYAASTDAPMPYATLNRQYTWLMIGVALAAALLCVFVGKYIYDRESKLAATELHRDALRLETLLQDGLEQTRALMEEAGLHIATSVDSEEDLRQLYEFISGENASPAVFSGAPVFLNRLFPWEYMVYFDHSAGEIMETKNIGNALFPAESLGELIALSAAEPYKLHIGNVFFGATGNRWTLPVALAIADKNGRPRGSLIVGLGMDGVAGMLEGGLNNPSTRFMLLDEQAFIVAQFKDRALEPYNGKIIRNYLESGDRAQGGLDADIWGDETTPAVRYVNMMRFPFTVVAGYDASFVSDRVFAPLRRAVSGIFVATAIILTLMATFRRRVVYPLTVLSEAASEISMGRAPKYYPAGECREIDVLSKQIQRVAEYNRELRESREELQQSYDLTRSALRYMARELKTPLGEIMAVSEILKHGLYGPLNAKQKDYVQSVHSAAILQNTLITAFLEQIREHEKGPAPLKKTECDLKKISEKYFNVFTVAAAEKKLQLSVKADADAPLADADADKIGNVVLNLVSNAIKYNRTGGKVTIRIESAQQGKFVKLTCEDSGFGMDKEDIPEIFAPFARIRNDETSNIDGAGLGLAYVKQIVSQHGGHITVKSERNVGSRFSCFIPATSEKSAAQDNDAAKTSAIKVTPKPPANESAPKDSSKKDVA